MEFQQGGDDDPWGTIVLDRESRKYMHASVYQYTFTYDENDVESKATSKFSINPCTESDFEPGYQLDFFNTYRGRNFHCVESAGAYLQGTRESRVAKEEHSFLVYDFEKCHDGIRAKQKKDPTCKDTEDTKCEMIDK